MAPNVEFTVNPHEWHVNNVLLCILQKEMFAIILS